MFTDWLLNNCCVCCLCSVPQTIKEDRERTGSNNLNYSHSIKSETLRGTVSLAKFKKRGGIFGIFGSNKVLVRCAMYGAMCMLCAVSLSHNAYWLQVFAKQHLILGYLLYAHVHVYCLITKLAFTFITGFCLPLFHATFSLFIVFLCSTGFYWHMLCNDLHSSLHSLLTVVFSSRPRHPAARRLSMYSYTIFLSSLSSLLVINFLLTNTVTCVSKHDFSLHFSLTPHSPHAFYCENVLCV